MISVQYTGIWHTSFGCIIKLFKMKRKFIILLLAFVPCCAMLAQHVSVKTNALYWAALSPNIGAEVSFAQRSSIALDGMMNLWAFKGNKKINFLAVQPEYRYWFCQPMSRHFTGIHLHYANYNGGFKKHRYNGNLYGAGVSYGYQWYLAPRWNLEATIGLGYAYMDHDIYERPKCGKFLGTGYRHYWGITKLGISIVYIIK